MKSKLPAPISKALSTPTVSPVKTNAKMPPAAAPKMAPGAKLPQTPFHGASDRHVARVNAATGTANTLVKKHADGGLMFGGNKVDKS